MAAPDDELDDAIAISALQHYSYCPRQCALIHAEQAWDENVYTLRGHAVHEQVDTPESRAEGEVRVERALPLYSRRLGLVGRADVVEFLPDGTPFPVEYKHGPRRAGNTTTCRWRHRRCAWRRCSADPCRAARFFTTVPGDGEKWRSRPHCAPRWRKWSPRFGRCWSADICRRR